jgi:hypothetical protein
MITREGIVAAYCKACNCPVDSGLLEIDVGWCPNCEEHRCPDCGDKVERSGKAKDSMGNEAETYQCQGCNATLIDVV